MNKLGTLILALLLLPPLPAADIVAFPSGEITLHGVFEDIGAAAITRRKGSDREIDAPKTGFTSRPNEAGCRTSFRPPY
jgi:hypothetical protein